jgi:hypothetical protein
MPGLAIYKDMDLLHLRTWPCTVKQHEGIHPCGYRNASICQTLPARRINGW